MEFIRIEIEGKGAATFYGTTMSDFGLKGPNTDCVWYNPIVDFSRFDCRFFFTEEGFEKIGSKIYEKAITRYRKVELIKTTLKEEKRPIIPVDDFQVAVVINDKRKIQVEWKKP